MGLNNPCKNCVDDRSVSCHATCDKYIKWKKEFDKLKQLRAKQPYNAVYEAKVKEAPKIFRRGRR